MNEEELKASILNGIGATNYEAGGKKNMIDKLHELFDGDSLVVIKNFTKETIGWAYSDRKDIHVDQPNEYTRRVTGIGQPRVRTVKPGKKAFVPGYEAYVGLVAFFNDWAYKKAPDNLKVIMNSPTAMDEFLSQAYGGLFDPNEPEEVISPKEEVEQDLGLKSGKDKTK